MAKSGTWPWHEVEGEVEKSASEELGEAHCLGPSSREGPLLNKALGKSGEVESSTLGEGSNLMVETQFHPGGGLCPKDTVQALRKALVQWKRHSPCLQPVLGAGGGGRRGYYTHSQNYLVLSATITTQPNLGDKQCLSQTEGPQHKGAISSAGLIRGGFLKEMRFEHRLGRSSEWVGKEK